MHFSSAGEIMVIFKCIVIVCDLQVVRNYNYYIWKEQTKLNLTHLFLSHFGFLYEYIVIKSEHFRIKNSDYIWKEQTKLNLAPLFASHFVFLYEYIVIKSEHFTIKICVVVVFISAQRQFQFDLTQFDLTYLEKY